jgi:dihydrolipoamide dehydrogenase
MTNREILDLRELPKTLVCIGGGVIGLEMACYFATVGVKVVVVEMMPKIAGPTDPEICAILMKTYQKFGMEFCLNAKVEGVTANSVCYSDAAGKHEVPCDRVLLSAGRHADTRGSNIEVLGLEMNRAAIVTDEHLLTNVPNCYAIGDCNGKLMLAHTAYREAEVAVNHMLGIKDKMDYSIVPSVIYTTPEVAAVGESEQSAKDKGLHVKVVKAPMMFSGRYVAETMNGDGFVKLIYDLDRHCLVGRRHRRQLRLRNDLRRGHDGQLQAADPAPHEDRLPASHRLRDRPRSAVHDLSGCKRSA